MSGRGYSWPPFREGHTLSLKHGADSPRTVEPVAAELRDWLSLVAPWTQGPSFAPAVASWAWAEARAQLVRNWLSDQPLTDDAGEVIKAATYLERLESRASNLRAELGLSPMSLAKLLGALSSIDAPAARQGLEALQATGAAIRQAAEQRALDDGSVADGDDGDQRGAGDGDEQHSEAVPTGGAM